MAEELDIIQTIFEHRLQQSDLDRILAALSSSDRNVLFEKIGDLLKRISSLVEVSNSVSDSLSLDVLLPRLMLVVTEALNADRGSLFLFDKETDELYSRVALGDSIGEIRFPSHMGIAGMVFTKNEPALIPDAYADERFNQDVDRRTGYRTRNILCAPLKNKAHDTIGVTQVLNKNEGDFDGEDLALLEAMTSQAAAALENAQLFERVQRAQREEAKLLEITSAISSELKLEPLLNKIISVTTEMLEADRSTLFLHDPKTDELWSLIAEGINTKEIRFPSFAGIAGECFTSGQPLNIPDAYADERFNQDVDRQTGYRTDNILCMPIINKEGRKLGIIQVLNKAGGPFGPTDERRLNAFTAQASIALENAQLFEDVLNARNYNESILKSLSNGVITLDADRKIIKINQAASKMLIAFDTLATDLNVDEIFDGDNVWLIETIDKVAESGKVDLSMDTDIHLPGGGELSVNLTTVPLIDVKDESIGFMLVIEDISKEKRVKSTMSRYMPKELVDKVLDGGESVLGGSAQEVTILFSDIRSFTTISEELGARETVTMLNEYFTDMIEVIFNHGGILDKFIGDAIMALFGAPFKSDHDADNALNVANEMMIALRELNRKRLSVGKDSIKIGVGISTGEVVAGNIGSPKRMDYTVIGDHVNLASRLEGATKYYGSKVLLCENAFKKVAPNNIIRELDLIRVKGQTHPVAIFEALDFHNEETFPNMEQALDAFAAGLEAYRQRDWQQAIKFFQAALAANPDDSPSTLYAERCRHYEANPPDDNWDGVWTMTSK